MWPRRGNKVIKGKVFFDLHNKGIEDEISQGIKNVTVRLFKVKQIPGENNEGKDSNFTILKERFIMSTKTNDKGEYIFVVNEGRYSIVLDVNTLPEGMGAVCSEVSVDISGIVQRDFEVRKVSSVQINNLKSEYEFDENITIDASLKDSDGNTLYGPLFYSSDSSLIRNIRGNLRFQPDKWEDKAVSINVRSGEVSSVVEIKMKTAGYDNFERIDSAYRTGLIDEKTKVLLYLYSIFDKEKLGVRSDIPMKSGTTAVKEILDYATTKRSQGNIAGEAQRYISTAIPDLDKVYISPGGYFRIHYTTSGTNAVPSMDSNSSGIPDYIELVGSSFDHVKDVTCTKREFRSPILDKGEKMMDVYVYDLKGVYGITFPSKFYNSKGGFRRASCYMAVDNTYSKEKGFDKTADECIRVTCAHEFFHAVQYAYNVDADNWWKEASATWNEDEIYDEVNDYLRYLPKVLSSPEKSLEKSSYGGVAFSKYLSERFSDYRIIRRIWEVQGFAYNKSVSAIDSAIKEVNRYESIGSIYNKYTACNFNPGQYYKEGHLWSKSVFIANTYKDYPLESKSSRLNHLAANYQLFKPSGNESRSELRVTVEGSSEAKWGFKLQCKKEKDGVCDLIEVYSYKTNDRAQIICHGFGQTYSEVCFIPANLEKKQDDIRYTYSASID